MSDIHTAEDTFISKTPSWLIQKGNLLIFCIFLVAVILSIIINYNDVISSEILITSKSPPVHLTSKKNARITGINVKADDYVTKNQVLLVLENNSKVEDVENLKNKLLDKNLGTNTIEELLKNYPSNLTLESSIQNSYQNFVSKYSQYILYHVLDESKIESENIQSQVKRTGQVLKNKQLQLDALSQRLKISEEYFDRNKTLFSKGVISQQELDEVQSEYLKSRAEYQNFKQEMGQLYVESLSLKNQSMKSDNLTIVNSTLYSFELQLAKQNLLSKITEWEDIHLIKSPIDGSITIFDLWNKNQSVEKGERIITVIPISQEGFIGICKVPIKNSGKIKVGQSVIIKMDNYPSREWGNLQGSVTSISRVPKKGRKSFYSVYVRIPSLNTSYGKKILFKQEMFGTANIILEETSLLTRVFYELRNIWSNSQL